MPDLNTVTFDASQWQLVPKVPTQEMLDAASHASMQHFIDCLYDPEKAKEIGSEENVRKTHASRYQSMLTAAPTPAAQGAGQEAAAWRPVETAPKDGTWFLAWRKHETKPLMLRWDAAYAEFENADGDHVYHVTHWMPLPRDPNAAPVNGGERELGQVIDERDRAEAMAEKLADAIAKHFGVEIGEHSNLNCPWQNALDHIAHMSAQDDKRNCQKCGGDCSAANPPVIHCPMEKHAADAPQVSDEIACSSCGLTLTQSRALSSPAKASGDGLIEQHARDSAELHRLCAARDEARRTAEYWKANHLAGNAEIERLKKLLEAKVGGDEREAFETYLRSIWTQGYGCAKDEEGRYRDGNAQSLWECWRAALSADGGEDKRDAELWRFLREQHEGTESFEDAEGFTVTEPTARAFTVFKPGQGDYHLEPVGCIPGELEETIRAAIAADQAKGDAS